jgi:FtsP/CotA-like multicopper oxidase with cupredoxin domain
MVRLQRRQPTGIILILFIAGMQYTDGVTGALVVHPTRNTLGVPSWDEDLVVQLADWYHTFSEDLLALYTRVRTSL